FLDGQRLRQIAQQQRDENLVGGDVEQCSFACTLTDRCKGTGIIALTIEAYPLDLRRQDIAVCPAPPRRVKKGEPGPVVADVAERNGRHERRLDRVERSLRIP